MDSTSKVIVIGKGGLLSTRIAEEVNKQNYVHWAYESYKNNRIKIGKTFILKELFELEVKKTATETAFDIYASADFVADQLATT